MGSHHRSEYIQDVPTDVKFNRILPPPVVSVPDIILVRPRILDVHYDFSKEKKAIAAYNERRKEMVREKEAGTSQSSLPAAPSTSSSSSTTSSPVPPAARLPAMWTDGILQPTVVDRRTTAKHTTTENGSSPLTVEASRKADPFDFKDFESATNVFDLMELKTIDDKAELEKLLRPSDSVKPAPVRTSCPPANQTTSTPVQAQSRDLASSTTSLYNRPTPLLPYNHPQTLPNTVSAPALISMQQQLLQQQQMQKEVSPEKPLSPAGERLVKDKKFPRAIVEYCEANLLPDEMEKLDYFVKALYNMSVKMKINKAEALIFLQSFNFDEKRKIVNVSDTVMQLCQMGFESRAVLNALRASAGQRTTALDHLLNHSMAASS